MSSSKHYCIVGKVRIKSSLVLINESPRHEDVRGSGDIAPPFVTSELDGGEWSASRLCLFTPGEIAPGIHCI
jgi:hypothetical protein